MRRSASPQPSRPRPIATARPMSRPVRGSVEDVDGSAAVFDADALAAVVLLDDDEVAVGAVDELEDVELGAGGWVVVEPDLLDEPE